MDGEWSNPWKSTVADFNHDLLKEYAEDHTYLQLPSLDDVEMLKVELQNLSLLLKFGDQTCWLKRAKILLSLQLPELAVGDAYKALLLAQASSSQEAQSTLVLAQALYMANSFLECISLLDDFTAQRQLLGYELRTLRRFAKAAYQKEQEEVSQESDVSPEVEHRDRSGEVVTQLYPWVNSAWFTRTSEVLETANTRLQESSSGRCEVRRSGISGSSDDCFGIFSSTAIHGGTHIFTDKTSICAMSGDLERCNCCQGEFLWSQVQLRCCETTARFCSWDCADTAREIYHNPVCGRPFRDPSIAARESANSQEGQIGERLWIRILAALKYSLDTCPGLYRHPLDVPFMNALTTKYGKVSRFSLAMDIVRPFDILRKLGIEIHTDFRFDTWVLRTIAARTETNLGQYYISAPDGDYTCELLALSELHHFFNHSCEPNVKVVRVDESGSELTLFAKRAIRQGEELFISYLNEDKLVRSYEDRAELLKDWTGGICNCSRCEKDRLAMANDSDGDFGLDESSCDSCDEVW